jgi:hypothetical protein
MKMQRSRIANLAIGIVAGIAATQNDASAGIG